MRTGKVECQTYAALENETPFIIANKLGLDANQLVALNKGWYPTLIKKARLKAQTVLRLPDVGAERALNERDNSRVQADFEEKSNECPNDNSNGSQTMIKTFWTHRAGPLLEELVDCIEELQAKHEFVIRRPVNQARSDGRAALRTAVRTHLESYERTHPGLYICTEFISGTRRRLSASALDKGRELGFSAKFFKHFEGFRTHDQLVSAVRKLLLDGGLSRQELFDSCKHDGVQPFQSQGHFSAWYNGSSVSDELENAVDQMLWDRIDETREDNAKIHAAQMSKGAATVGKLAVSPVVVTAVTPAVEVQAQNSLAGSNLEVTKMASQMGKVRSADDTDDVVEDCDIGVSAKPPQPLVTSLAPVRPSVTPRKKRATSFDVTFQDEGILGIKWKGKSGDWGDRVTIAEVAPTCEHYTKLRAGLMLTEIQGFDVLTSTFEEVIQVINNVPRPLQLTFVSVGDPQRLNAKPTAETVLSSDDTASSAGLSTAAGLTVGADGNVAAMQLQGFAYRRSHVKHINLR
eukprot:COSAG02_NODE_5200_length_4546_cov_4.043850_3_plen_519_part_00